MKWRVFRSNVAFVKIILYSFFVQHFAVNLKGCCLCRERTERAVPVCNKRNYWFLITFFVKRVDRMVGVFRNTIYPENTILSIVQNQKRKSGHESVCRLWDLQSKCCFNYKINCFCVQKVPPPPSCVHKIYFSFFIN